MRREVLFSAVACTVWLCCLSIRPVQGGKLLVVPMDGSHWLSMKILVKEIVNRGHEVLVLVPESSLLMSESESFKKQFYPVQFTQAEMEGSFKSLSDGVFQKPPQIADMLLSVELFVNFTKLQLRGCESLLHNQQLMSQLRDSGFDAVLTDPFLPCGSILARVFSIPAVYFLRGLPCQLDTRANMCPSPPSYVPSTYSGYPSAMTFSQRVNNMFMYFVETYMCHLLFGHYDEFVRQYFREDMTYTDLISHGAIWLLRYDFVFEWPRPVMPNMVFIGGINCMSRSPLPADLAEFVEGSGDDGFIIFTLGSMVSKMPAEIAKQFLEAFRQIPQRVLWRYTGVPLENVPENVKLMKWLPQNDLLGHPKAKVFMTHGGTHGIYEGICNGVPMLMFPLFGDQGENVRRFVARGVALSLNIHDVTSDELVTALNTIVQDKGFKERMMKLSQVHLDRPLSPVDLSAFWTEFVMRHKGASHLRVAAHDLNWIQYHSLDVIGLLVMVIVTVLWVTLKCCLFCTRRCCRKRTAKKKSE
ncbi:UDP-glucuronosyltransferase-like [Cynoglossus semilaevis]|uniref:UDP-glucuronosyltransferase n=1 Tax=Cynoglossus semilaevis TaxID=244447 RepID=A0A3P8WCX2_CYNSE|nr:UDP-glucuronosyltransferase-like [Cynoglossus semilaevis]